MQDGAYAFGDFSLSPSERRLFHAGRDVALPPKAFDALLLLVRQHGSLVSRDEIIHTLWPNIHVEETNLTNIIVLLRKLLGKEAIQTVSKFGYRFSLPVTAEPGMKQAAYATFVRAKELASQRSPDSLIHARELLWICLAEDPHFAPAWAWLGRTCRLLQKFRGETPGGDNLAQAAYRRAFAIDPELACAHQFYTQYQVDTGQSEQAMLRLAGRIQKRGEDPETLTGLVQVLRCCGLFDESIAAHERAVALDPTTQTSVAHTYFLKGEYTKVFETYTGFRLYLDAAAWAGLGDTQHAAALLRPRLAKNEMSPLMAGPGASLLAALEGRRDDVLAILESMRSFHEPEAQFYLARHSAMVGAVEPTLELLQRARTGGFLGPFCLQHDRVFDSMRALPQFQEELQTCLCLSQQASRKFHQEFGQLLNSQHQPTPTER
jgi:DNA-binding winged helix-turn-helix (wHTH) protein